MKMAQETEINAFIVKFKQLWNSGFSAHLDLDSCDGKAWVGLRLNLGDAPGVGQVHREDVSLRRTQNSPSKERRRNRRAALRENMKNENVSESTEQVENDMVENEIHSEEEDILEEDTIATITTEEVVTKHADSEEELENMGAVDNLGKDVDSVPESTAQVVTEISVDISEIEAEEVVSEETDGKTTVDSKDVEQILKEETESGEAETKSDKAKSSEIPGLNKPADALVYGTVDLESSPYNQVTRSQIDSVSKIIDCKEHLQRNISDFEFGKISSWNSGHQRYKHQIQLIIQVKTAQLWESPRSYLWRHLGTSVWTLEDGTQVSISRIHQK